MVANAVASRIECRKMYTSMSITNVESDLTELYFGEGYIYTLPFEGAVHARRMYVPTQATCAHHDGRMRWTSWKLEGDTGWTPCYFLDAAQVSPFEVGEGDGRVELTAVTLYLHFLHGREGGRGSLARLWD